MSIGYGNASLLRLGAAIACLATMFAFPKAAIAGNAKTIPSVVVQVYNHSRAPQSVVDGAEREAGRIFAQSGVRVLWLTCSTGASADESDTCQKKSNDALRLELLSSGAYKSRGWICGFAVHPNLARVLYEDVLNLAMTYEMEASVSRILGGVMAHEIGHLLLGPNAHAATGVMRSPWSFDQVRQSVMGALSFTSAQSQTLQAALQKREQGKDGIHSAL